MAQDIKDKKYWFKRRRYGYGWIPVTWQGWATLGALLAVLLITSFVVLPEKPEQPTGSELAIFFGVFLVLVVMLVLISYRKGPRPKWRWGKSESDNSDEDF
jgi:uncharacterized membrane protein YhaH (DUF805 family)